MVFYMVAHLLKLGDIDFNTLTMSRDLKKNTPKIRKSFIHKWNEERKKYLEIENRN